MRRFNNYDLDGQPPVLAWNPLAMRCSPVSSGCLNCWHLRMCDRLSRNHSFPPSVRMAYEGGEVEALKSFTAYPPSGRVIAVQFMGDLWHTSVLQSYRDCILSTISQCPESVFLLLTKRPHLVYESIPDNAWMGASCHDVRSMYIAMKILSKINARNLWISVEPLISHVAVMPILAPNLGFIAVGPETIGGKEIQPGFTEEFINACGHVIFQSGVTLYDKRKNWTVRDWPGAWKDLKKGNG